MSAELYSQTNNSRTGYTNLQNISVGNISCTTVLSTGLISSKTFFLDGQNSVAQVIPNATNTAIAFDTVNISNNFPLPTAGNTKFTIPQVGWWQVTSSVTWNTGAGTLRILYLRVNGNNNLRYGQQIVPPVSGDNTAGASISPAVFFNGTSDYFEIIAYQDSGGNLNSGDTAPSALINRIGVTYLHQ